MGQIRINELCRELEVKSKHVLNFLPQIGVTEKKTHSSPVDDLTAERVRAHFRGWRNTRKKQTSVERQSVTPTKGASTLKQPPGRLAARGRAVSQSTASGNKSEKLRGKPRGGQKALHRQAKRPKRKLSRPKRKAKRLRARKAKISSSSQMLRRASNVWPRFVQGGLPGSKR